MNLQNHPPQRKSELRLAGNAAYLEDWRLKGIALLRCSFGGLWGFIAWQSCQSGFQMHLSNLSYQQGNTWSSFGTHLLSVQPVLTSYVLAVCESVLALSLLLGIFSNTIYLGGGLLSIFLWSTLGRSALSNGMGNETAGATLLFLMVFLALFLSNAGSAYGLDRYLLMSKKAKGQTVVRIDTTHIPLRQPTGIKTSTGQHPIVPRSYPAHPETDTERAQLVKKQRYAPM